MTTTFPRLLAAALLAGLATSASASAASASDDCRLRQDRADKRAIATDLVQEPADAALLSVTPRDEEEELRVRLHGRGGGRHGIRLAAAGEDRYRLSVRLREGETARFTERELHNRRGRLELRIRAAVADAEGERVRVVRATVRVLALVEECPQDEPGEDDGAEAGDDRSAGGDDGRAGDDREGEREDGDDRGGEDEDEGEDDDDDRGGSGREARGDDRRGRRRDD